MCKNGRSHHVQPGEATLSCPALSTASGKHLDCTERCRLEAHSGKIHQHTTWSFVEVLGRGAGTQVLTLDLQWACCVTLDKTLLFSGFQQLHLSPRA